LCKTKENRGSDNREMERERERERRSRQQLAPACEIFLRQLRLSIIIMAPNKYRMICIRETNLKYGMCFVNKVIYTGKECIYICYRLRAKSVTEREQQSQHVGLKFK
jgi:hypothetical protein